MSKLNEYFMKRIHFFNMIIAIQIINICICTSGYSQNSNDDNSSKKATKEIYELAYELGSTAISYYDYISASRYSDEEFKSYGIANPNRMEINRLIKNSKTKLFSIQIKYNEMDIDISIQKIIDLLNSEKFEKSIYDGNHVFVEQIISISEDYIREKCGLNCEDFHLIGLFTSLNKYSGYLPYENELIQYYSETSPIVNSILQKNQINFSIKEIDMKSIQDIKKNTEFIRYFSGPGNEINKLKTIIDVYFEER
jgi:hypothetical protein